MFTGLEDQGTCLFIRHARDLGELVHGQVGQVRHGRHHLVQGSQAGDVAPNLVADGSWLSSSDLTEAGVKFQLLRGTLIGSVAAYKQNRTQIAGAIAPPTMNGETITACPARA